MSTASQIVHAFRKSPAQTGCAELATFRCWVCGGTAERGILFIIEDADLAVDGRGPHTAGSGRVRWRSVESQPGPIYHLRALADFDFDAMLAQLLTANESAIRVDRQASRRASRSSSSLMPVQSPPAHEPGSKKRHDRAASVGRSPAGHKFGAWS